MAVKTVVQYKKILQVLEDATQANVTRILPPTLEEPGALMVATAVSGR